MRAYFTGDSLVFNHPSRLKLVGKGDGPYRPRGIYPVKLVIFIGIYREGNLHLHFLAVPGIPAERNSYFEQQE
jgi:hypothetical protein